MTYACAAAIERTRDPLTTNAKKTMNNRCDKCINTLDRQHVNRRVLIRKRLGRLTSLHDAGAGALAPPMYAPRAARLHYYEPASNRSSFTPSSAAPDHD